LPGRSARADCSTQRLANSAYNLPRGQVFCLGGKKRAEFGSASRVRAAAGCAEAEQVRPERQLPLSRRVRRESDRDDHSPGGQAVSAAAVTPCLVWSRAGRNVEVDRGPNRANGEHDPPECRSPGVLAVGTCSRQRKSTAAGSTLRRYRLCAPLPSGLRLLVLVQSGSHEHGLVERAIPAAWRLRVPLRARGNCRSGRIARRGSCPLARRRGLLPLRSPPRAPVGGGW
jgi:hypothetical protein